MQQICHNESQGGFRDLSGPTSDIFLGYDDNLSESIGLT